MQENQQRQRLEKKTKKSAAFKTIAVQYARFISLKQVSILPVMNIASPYFPDKQQLDGVPNTLFLQPQNFPPRLVHNRAIIVHRNQYILP